MGSSGKRSPPVTWDAERVSDVVAKGLVAAAALVLMFLVFFVGSQSL